MTQPMKALAAIAALLRRADGTKSYLCECTRRHTLENTLCPPCLALKMAQETVADPAPAVLIKIEGGVIQEIKFDQPIEVHIIDEDCPENGEPRYHRRVATTIVENKEILDDIEEAKAKDEEDALL